MANRTHHPIECAKSDMVILTAKLTGGGAAADMVNADSAHQGAGEIVSAVYAAATGVFTVTFRHAYPELKFAPIFSVVGTTDGLHGMCSAIDVAAKTATFEIYVGSTKTDPATTDTLYVMWAVRNSGKNA